MSKNFEKRLERMEKSLSQRSAAKCNCADPNAMFRQRYGIPLSQAKREELGLTCPVHPVRRISKWLILVAVDKDGNRFNHPRTPEGEEYDRLIEEYRRRRRAQFEAASKGAYDEI